MSVGVSKHPPAASKPGAGVSAPQLSLTGGNSSEGSSQGNAGEDAGEFMAKVTIMTQFARNCHGSGFTSPTPTEPNGYVSSKGGTGR